MFLVASSTTELIAVIRPCNCRSAPILHRDSHVTPDRHPGGVLLRDAEIHINRIKGLQAGQRVPGRKILSEVDLTKAQDSRKRRADGLPIDHCADFFNPGCGFLLFGGSSVVFGAGDGAFIDQTLHALKVEARQVARGFNGGQLRLFLSGVELYKEIAFVNGGAGLESDLATMPGRSALTVTPWTAAAVPMAFSVAGQYSFRATMVVTASGGG